MSEAAVQMSRGIWALVCFIPEHAWSVGSSQQMLRCQARASEGVRCSCRAPSPLSANRTAAQNPKVVAQLNTSRNEDCLVRCHAF